MKLPVLATFWAPHWFKYIPLLRNSSLFILSSNSLNPRFSFTANGVQIKVIRSNHILTSEMKSISIEKQSLIVKPALRLKITTVEKGNFHAVFEKNDHHLKTVRDEIKRLEALE